MRKFEDDFSKATSFFIHNKGKLEECLNGTLVNIELDNKKLAKLLDREAGIDYFYINNKKEVFGVSARVNFNPTMSKCVTIRCSRGYDKRYIGVEFEKGVRAYKNKKTHIIARYGLQMDADNKLLKEFIIYDRKELFLYAYNNFDEIKEQKLKTVKADGNTYLRFEFDDFKKIGVWHKIYNILK